jgi:DNA-binding NtrC family response regulator
VYFPVIEDTVLQYPNQQDQIEQTRSGNETILLIDDEDYLLDLGQRTLAKFGYTVLTAADGETALQIYREQGSQISLVILDLIMPGIGGKNCLHQILEENPSAKVIIASGYSVDESTRKEIELKSKGFIKKPFELNQMLTIIRQTLDDNMEPDAL